MHLLGLLLPLSGAPVKIRVTTSKNAITETIQSVLHSSATPMNNTCEIGAIFSHPSGGTKNVLATAIRTKFSRKLPEGLAATWGPCLVLGEDEKGNLTSLSNESIEKVASIYKEVTGLAAPGLIATTKAKKQDAGPKKLRRDYDFFASTFHAARSLELKNQNIKPVFADIAKEAREAWKTMAPADKSPFAAKAAEDKARYEREYAAFIQTHPPKPNKALTANFFFCQTHPDKDSRPEYKTLTDEAKAPFEAKAAQDRERYEQQLAKFKEYCEANQLNFDEEMAPKKRKPSAAAPKKKAVQKADAPAPKKTSAPKKTTKPKAKPAKKPKRDEEEAEDAAPKSDHDDDDDAVDEDDAEADDE